MGTRAQGRAREERRLAEIARQRAVTGPRRIQIAVPTYRALGIARQTPPIIGQTYAGHMKAMQAGIMAEGEGANEAMLLEIRRKEQEVAQERQTLTEVKKKAEDKKKWNRQIGAALIILVIIGLLFWGGKQS